MNHGWLVQTHETREAAPRRNPTGRSPDDEPAGDGRFGQSDLAGNRWEFYLDAYTATPVTPCTDCAYLDPVSAGRGIRGGGWASQASTLRSYDPSPYEYPRTMRTYAFGARCARRL